MSFAAGSRSVPAVTLLSACLAIACHARIKHLPDLPTSNNDRHSLIIASVLDGSMYTSWLEGSDAYGRNWDLVLLYYGDNPSFNCPECTAVWHGTGAKWNLIHRFLEENPNLTDRYCSVMMLDDDINITTTTLNTYFDMFVDLSLTLAQPSLCPGSNSAWYNVVGQNPKNLLHFTSFVELMAPTASASFFKDILAPTLNNSYTGWGLDFVWPFLAGLPHDKVGVIDAVCMSHPGGGGGFKGRQRVYDVEGLPWTPEEEWNVQMMRNNVTKEAVEAAGLQWNTPHVFADEFVQWTDQRDEMDLIGGDYLIGFIAALSMTALVARRMLHRSGMLRRPSETSLPLVGEKTMPRPASRTLLNPQQQ